MTDNFPNTLSRDDLERFKFRGTSQSDVRVAVDQINNDAVSTLNSTKTPLGSGATYTGTYESIINQNSILVLIATNQPSIGNGIAFDFSDDGITTRRTIFHTFSASDVTNGSAVFIQPPSAQFFRVRYTNGSTAQGSFFLQCWFHTVALEMPRASIISTLDDSNNAVTARSVQVGKTAAGGVYVNQEYAADAGNTGLGYAKVDVAQADVALPIKALTSMQVGSSIGLSTTTPSAIASPALANRRSILVMADPSNSKSINIGHGSSAGACVFVLAAGVGVVLEVDATVGIWAYSPGGAGQNVQWIEVAGTP